MRIKRSIIGSKSAEFNVLSVEFWITVFDFFRGQEFGLNVERLQPLSVAFKGIAASPAATESQPVLWKSIGAFSSISNFM